MQAENQVLKHELSDLDVELTAKRDALTQIKHERDALRAENATRRQQRGLVRLLRTPSSFTNGNLTNDTVHR